jgi:hypothetical protein
LPDEDEFDQEFDEQEESRSGYVPPATQEDLDRIIQERLRRHKPADYDELRDKASRLEALELEMSSDQEKAERRAREEALRETAPRLVRAEFKAAAKGVLSGDQLNAVLEDLDLSKYVTKDGEVDEAKVQRKITALTPKGSNGTGSNAGFGQGRQQQARLSAREQGAAEAAKRFKKTA